MWNNVENPTLFKKRLCGLFFVIILAVGFIITLICLIVFVPEWSSNIKPGMDIIPKLEGHNTDSTLIWYIGSKIENYKSWIDELDKSLEEYRRPGGGRQSCDYNNPPGSGQVCKVHIKDWKPCVSEESYSYGSSAPCIFLKFNKVLGWIPEYYNNSKDLPENAPEDLKSHINVLRKASPKALNTVWVSCEGENPADIENIGTVEYIPRRGFPGYYYPYNNIEGYLSPLVAVHFERPNLGVLISIECKAWAKNIKHEEGNGYVRFQLIID